MMLTYAFACIVSGPALGETFPSRAITVIVPTTPGSGTDIGTRLIADHMSKTLGQPVVIENVGGAIGIVGTRRCADATADGYTICATNYGQIVLAPFDYKARGEKLGYEVSSLRPVARTLLFDFVLVAHKNVGATLPEVLAYARAHNGLTVGNGGTTGEYATKLLRGLQATKVVFVPYRGDPLAMADVLNGSINAAFMTATVALPHLKSDIVRVVGTVGRKKSALLQTVPTLYEQGCLACGDLDSWGGMFAPNGVPEDRMRILSRAVLAALHDPGVIEKLEKAKLTAYPAAPDVFANVIKHNIAEAQKR